MIEWTPYSNPDKGAYAYHAGLTLIAEHSGAWSIFDLTRRHQSSASEMAPILYPPAERNIESAKAKAEAAAIKMLAPDAPPDPDAHLSVEAYLKAKQERAKDTDFTDIDR